MKKILVGVISLLVVCMASAQAQTRVRGTITDVQGDVLKVKTVDGRDVEVKLAPDAAVVTPKKVSAKDFKEGSYVGVTVGAASPYVTVWLEAVTVTFLRVIVTMPLVYENW